MQTEKTLKRMLEEAKTFREWLTSKNARECGMKEQDRQETLSGLMREICLLEFVLKDPIEERECKKKILKEY